MYVQYVCRIRSSAGESFEANGHQIRTEPTADHRLADSLGAMHVARAVLALLVVAAAAPLMRLGDESNGPTDSPSTSSGATSAPTLCSPCPMPDAKIVCYCPVDGAGRAVDGTCVGSSSVPDDKSWLALHECDGASPLTCGAVGRAVCQVPVRSVELAWCGSRDCGFYEVFIVLAICFAAICGLFLLLDAITYVRSMDEASRNYVRAWLGIRQQQAVPQDDTDVVSPLPQPSSSSSS